MRSSQWLLFFISLCIATLTQADNRSISTELDNYLKTSVEDGFSGAVLIVQDGKVVLNKGYGLADREDKLPITDDTLFDIGSVTKQFTAAAIMRLVQSGKLTTSMTINDFFEDVPEDKQKITIHQLLTHSSGIANGMGARDFDHVSTDEFFARLFATPLYFKPGEGYAYSNSGYSFLAYIVEQVSGQSYDAFMKESIFLPAGMHHTGYLYENLASLPAATGYLFGEVSSGSTRDRYVEDGKIAWPLKGNGGILSTMNDMYLWSKALQSEAVLSAKYRDQLFMPHMAEDDEGTSHYGYGWAVMQTPRETRFIGHNGSNGVYYFDFRWFPDENALILFASNAMVADTMALPFHVEKYVFDSTPLPAFNRGITSEMVKLSLNTPGSAQEKLSALQTQFAKNIDNKRLLNRAGLMLSDQGYHDDAIAMLSLNVRLFDDDGNLWDSLGEAYYANKQFKLAREAFSKALAISPEENCFWCENSQEKLNAIKE